MEWDEAWLSWSNGKENAKLGQLQTTSMPIWVGEIGFFSMSLAGEQETMS